VDRKNYRYQRIPYFGVHSPLNTETESKRLDAYNMSIIMKLEPFHFQGGMKGCAHLTSLGLIIQTHWDEGMQLKCLCCKEVTGLQNAEYRESDDNLQN
jgi:hypothetical protein